MRAERACEIEQMARVAVPPVPSSSTMSSQACSLSRRKRAQAIQNSGLNQLIARSTSANSWINQSRRASAPSRAPAQVECGPRARSANLSAAELPARLPPMSRAMPDAASPQCESAAGCPTAAGRCRQRPATAHPLPFRVTSARQASQLRPATPRGSPAPLPATRERLARTSQCAPGGRPSWQAEVRTRFPS